MKETGPDMAKSFTHKRPKPDTASPSTRLMACGHPHGCLVQADGGTAHCGRCEEVAGLRAALAKRIHKHRADVASVLYARNEFEEQVYEWYEECCEEVKKLQEELERVVAARDAILSVPVKIHGVPCDTCGGTDWQCAECLENAAGDALFCEGGEENVGL